MDFGFVNFDEECPMISSSSTNETDTVWWIMDSPSKTAKR
jgi:hypothetical protein